MRPLPIPHLHDWRKVEMCLINLIMAKMMGVFKILQYSEMECMLCKENYYMIV